MFSSRRNQDRAEKLTGWEQPGVARTFVTFWHPFARPAYTATLMT